MRFKRLLSLLLLSLTAGLACAAATTLPNELSGREVLPQESDPISGEWDLLFFVQGTTTRGTLKLKLDGEKITGTVASAHTGPGTVSKGSWADNKLNLTLDFKSHESIDISGSLKDGKLSGEFRTEGFVSNWEATKKGAQTQSKETTQSAAPALDPISGEWDAALEARGSKAPITFKFTLDGNKLSGTFESSHLGSGTLGEGSWADGKISFTMNGAHGAMVVKGTPRDGKLSGGFDGGQMKGTWQARRK